MKKTINSEVAKSNVTKFAELWKGHKDLPRTEQGAIILTDEKVCMLEPPHRYNYQKHDIKVLSKRSGVEEAGGRTLYEVNIDGDLHKSVDITRIKQLIGCTYSRGKDGANNDKTPAGKLYYLLSKSEVIKLAEDCKDPQILATLTQLRGLAGVEKKAEDDAKAKAKAENDAKVKQEKKDNSLISQVAQRLSISEAEARKMLGL
jgi:hypothetical protein